MNKGEARCCLDNFISAVYGLLYTLIMDSRHWLYHTTEIFQSLQILTSTYRNRHTSTVSHAIQHLQLSLISPDDYVGQ